MTCLICNGEAKSFDPLGDYQDRDCSDCGRYQITRTLLLELEASKKWLDIEATRLWIAINKASGGVPKLSTSEAKQQNLIRG
jgi:hypothetical protein